MVTECIDLDIDVTEEADLGCDAFARVTITRPSDFLQSGSIVCFAFPGAGFSRRYFTFDMPDSSGGGQAGWHADRGWIFVSVDSVGIGEASLPDPATLLFDNMSAMNHAVVQEVLRRLREGTLADDFAPVTNPVVLGLGQSMGGSMVIVQQARHETFDAIGVLGFSAIFTRSGIMPGGARGRNPFVPRDNRPVGASFMAPPKRDAAAVNKRLMSLHSDTSRYFNPILTPPSWAYHFDDEPKEIVERDLDPKDPLPPWRSRTVPGFLTWVTAPGAVAAEAASVLVPVISAFGERDTLDDPRLEAKAYRNAADFCLFICPRMAHMHNFAGTRELFWMRIHCWGEHVAKLKSLIPDDWPIGLFSDTY